MAARSSSTGAAQAGPSARPDHVSSPGNRPALAAALLERPYDEGHEIAEVKELAPRLAKMLDQHLADRDDLNRFVIQHGQNPVRADHINAIRYQQKKEKAEASGAKLGFAAEKTPLFNKINTIVSKHTVNPPHSGSEGSA